MTRIVIISLIGILSIGGCSSDYAEKPTTQVDPGWMASALLFRDIEKSVVLLRAYSSEDRYLWSGSAVVTAISPEGEAILVTAKHCVEGAAHLRVVYDYQERDAKLLQKGSHDWAIISSSGDKLKASPRIADLRKVPKFSRVYAAGYALKIPSITLTEGFVLGYSASEVSSNARDLRISAPIIFGNSGGGVFTPRGGVPSLIAITVAGRLVSGQFVTHMSLCVSLEDIIAEGGKLDG